MAQALRAATIALALKHWPTKVHIQPVTTGIETPLYPITPASVACKTTTVVVTSTNSNGAITTITTALTAKTDITTKNSLGFTVVATSTYVSIAIATTTPTLQTETSPACAQDNNTYYMAGGYAYEIHCGFDFYGSDFSGLQTDNLADCLLACSDYTSEAGLYGAIGASSVAASSQSPGNDCCLKYGIHGIDDENPGVPSSC